MTTATLNRIAKARQYAALCRSFPPRIIRNKAALAEAHQVIERLMSLGDKMTRDQTEYLDLLASLVERYESENFPTPTATPGAMLQHLIEAGGVSRAQVARETKIPRSTITEVIQGGRRLSADNICRLARYFSVSSDLFFEA